jgi:hypothetical protein
LFCFDNSGETVSLPEELGQPPVLFFRSYLEAEQAIQDGHLKRPALTVNGEVVWEWNKTP